MKIFCIGRNYADHAAEMNSQVPEKPMVFMKPLTALCSGDTYVIPAIASEIHYELELVLRINKNGKNIPKGEALNYIDAIGLGIDFTARTIQNECKEKGHPWEIAKAFDNSAYLSQLTSFDASRMPITFELYKNDNRVQQGNTEDLIFSFGHLIHYISQYFTIEKGDLIYTGTPAGVGPILSGDKLEGFIDGKSDFILNIASNNI